MSACAARRDEIRDDIIFELSHIGVDDDAMVLKVLALYDERVAGLVTKLTASRLAEEFAEERAERYGKAVAFGESARRMGEDRNERLDKENEALSAELAAMTTDRDYWQNQADLRARAEEGGGE